MRTEKRQKTSIVFFSFCGKNKKKKKRNFLVGRRPSPSAALIGVAACRAQTLIPRARLEASLGQLSLSTDKQVTVTEATLPRRVSRLDG